MKNFIKTILFLCILLVFVSCDNKTYPYYQLGNGTYVPDSNKVKLADFITKTVSATNLNMTGGDYEDPEDVIVQAERTGEKLFGVNTVGLIVHDTDNSYGEFIPKSRLSDKQLIIFNNLSK